MKVFCISPHTDDVELSMGGALLRHVDAGDEVSIIACTVATSPQGMASNSALYEQERSARFLDAVLMYDHGLLSWTRKLEERRQHVLDWFLRLKKMYQPDIVYLPSSFTTHQDHVTVYREGFRAFKDCTLFGYEDPWNNRCFAPTRYVEFNQKILEQKIHAVGKYISQEHRLYMQSSSITALARARAVAIGSEMFAEAFEVIREVDRFE